MKVLRFETLNNTDRQLCGDDSRQGAAVFFPGKTLNINYVLMPDDQLPNRPGMKTGWSKICNFMRDPYSSCITKRWVAQYLKEHDITSYITDPYLDK